MITHHVKVICTTLQICKVNRPSLPLSNLLYLMCYLEIPFYFSCCNQVHYWEIPPTLILRCEKGSSMQNKVQNESSFILCSFKNQYLSSWALMENWPLFIFLYFLVVELVWEFSTTNHGCWGFKKLGGFFFIWTIYFYCVKYHSRSVVTMNYTILSLCYYAGKNTWI